MKKLSVCLLPLVSLMTSCTSQPAPATPVVEQQAPLPDSTVRALPAPPAASAVAEANPPTEALLSEPDTADQYALMYVVVADTSQQYTPLRRQMLRLHEATGQRIDTMGRFYDRAKNLIRLPDDDEDELYAGDYFPRRMPDATLSVEYTALYTKGRPKSMALVTGIFQEPAPADSLLRVVRRTVPTAFRLKTRMFMGCLH
jgi:hypothetical protein